MRPRRPELDVQAVAMRAAAIVQTLDEVLVAVQADAIPLPDVLPAYSSQATLEVQAALHTVAEDRTALEAERAALEMEAANCADRAERARRQGRSAVAAEAERRRDEWTLAAAAFGEEIAQIHELCERVTHLLGPGGTDTNGADV